MTALLDVERPADRRPPSAPADWRVVTAVARVEGRRLVRHPATLAGLAISTAVAVAYFRLYAPVLHRDVATLSVTAAPLAAGVLLAAHLATSRIHRDETSAITGATPVPPERRTLGLAVAVLWPATLALAWVAAGLAVLAMLGGIGTPHPADVLATPGFVLLAGAVGVALGRWLPEPAGPLLTLPILGIGLSQLATAATTAVRLTPWADWFPSLGFIEVWPRAPWVHLTYVVLLAAGVAGVAALRDRATAATVTVPVTCLLLAAVFAGRLLAVWDDASAVAALERSRRDPAALLTCSHEPPVEVCAPAAYLPWAPDLATPARGTLELLPTSDRPDGLRIELTDVWSIALIGSLPDAVYRELATADHDRQLPDDTILLPAYRRADRPEAGPFAIALETARTGLDLGGSAPSTSVGGNVLETTCTARGQAREVIAFALAVSADPAARRALEAELGERPYGWQGEGRRWWSDDFWVDVGWHPTTAILWSRSGATNGLRLAERLPDITVLHERWGHWTDPATSADELLAAFGLEPLPTPRELSLAEGLDPGSELPTDSDVVAPPC